MTQVYEAQETRLKLLQTRPVCFRHLELSCTSGQGMQTICVCAYGTMNVA